MRLVACRSLFSVLGVLVPLLLLNNLADAQIQAPDRKFLFEEDKVREKKIKEEREEIKKKRREIKDQLEVQGQLPFDIDSKTIVYDSTGNVVELGGNVIIRYLSTILEADKAKLNLDTKDVELEGDIFIDDLSGEMSAERGSFNLDSKEGNLESVDVFFKDGDFTVQAEEVRKVGKEDYEFDGAALSTCQCPEEGQCFPWHIQANQAEVTREGYGQVWGAFFKVNCVPVFYLPYFIFPVKTERQTGLLPATFGSGRNNGFQMQLPFFWAIDPSTDLTLAPLVETETRYGVDSEFRKIFSLKSNLKVGFTYLNESARDGELQGTNIDGLDDPEIGTDRYAGYVNHKWETRVFRKNVQFITDANYVSDDLFLREFEKDQIARFNSRYVTSRALVRSNIFDTYSLDAAVEYSQAMVADDDFVLQRLPELELAGFNVFRPFPKNQYGARVILTSEVTATNFDRRKSFTGIRTDARERIRVPFHYKNYFDAEIEGELRGTHYSLDERNVIDIDDETGEDLVTEVLPSSSDRLVPSTAIKLSTVLEKVFPVSQGNLIKKIADLGRSGRSEQLARLKHTIEPVVKYRYTPFVSQDENPQFDSLDRLSQRNVVSYKLVQRLFARYEPRNEYLYGIEETTPEIEDLGHLMVERPLEEQFAFGFDNTGTEYQAIRRGSVKELVTFSLGQSFDVNEEREDNISGRGAFSDLNFNLTLFLNDHVRLAGRGDYYLGEQEFSAYTLESQLVDNRGDLLRARLKFVEDSIRQLEGNLEFKITDRVRLGYYTRYDDLDGKFIENRGGIRFASKCDCWLLDLEVLDRINPDETKFSFNVTLKGIGELGNTFFTRTQERTSLN